MKKKILALFLVGALVLPLAGETFGVQADAAEAATEEGYQYMNTGNLLTNPGFDSSTDATVSSGDWKLVTEGWKTNYAVGSAYYDWALPSDNTHSGAKAFKVTIRQLKEDGNTYTELRLYHTQANERSVTPAAGNYEGLTANTEYIVSFWVKGTADARIMTKTSTNTTEYTAEKTISEEEWTLVTKTFTPYDADADGDYEYWWNVYLKGTAVGQYAIVDDVQLVTVDQAKKNVETMIAELDVTADYAERAIKDIEQWCSVLGEDKISNYYLFENKINGKYQYMDTGNLLTNPGFESSTGVQNVSAAWDEVTTDWMPDYEAKSAAFDFSLVSDAHSGDNALSVTMKTSNDSRNISLFNSCANKDSTEPRAGRYEELEKNTKYIASYWVKGTITKAYIKHRTDETATSSSWAKVDNPGSDEWKLVTLEFKPYDTGEKGAYWWCVYLEGANGTSAVIDDVQMVKRTDAIANVEKMITELDVTDANADRAMKDIEAWCEVLSSTNISNYDTYTKKVNSLNTMKEDGTPLVVPYTSAAYKALKGFGGTEAAKAPVRDGFVFTGWFNSSDVATAAKMNTHVLLDSAGENLTKYNTVYARFVDKGMLTVKAQVGKEVKAESEEANIRFVTTVDNLAYDEVGFKITINDVSKELKSSGVYKKLYEGFLSGGANVLYPTEFYKGSVYFNARTIEKIPKGAFDTEIKVTPYIKTKDGTKVYGESATKTVRLGIEANAAMSAGQ